MLRVGEWRLPVPMVDTAHLYSEIAIKPSPFRGYRGSHHSFDHGFVTQLRASRQQP